MGGHAAKRMLAMLREHIPEHGPDFKNREKVKQLDDGIYELREQPKKGPKPRVFFFKDGDRVIVTTEATAKKDDDVSGFIEKAKQRRAAYMSAKALGQTEVKPWAAGD